MGCRHGREPQPEVGVYVVLHTAATAGTSTTTAHQSKRLISVHIVVVLLLLLRGERYLHPCRVVALLRLVPSQQLLHEGFQAGHPGAGEVAVLQGGG